VDPESDATLATEIAAGNEQAFIDLVARHHGPFMRLALLWVGSPSIAEEVVQETWTVALEKLPEFEGRSTLKTWLCGILLNTARARARKERRTVSVPSFNPDEAGEPAVPADRFSPPRTPLGRALASAPARLARNAGGRLPLHGNAWSCRDLSQEPAGISARSLDPPRRRRTFWRGGL
jgi:DNA-directed RNA polymerase specialized sigma24 family protein